ncbi:P-loop containing nucleoside triphosphate hydrolase protein [Irpex rosettiformis]|uniref:P-loop containing nucleoside triphosphate hydrolase protein n=1 Tax=Irpex rosettiformis TaxID=378272 RepID=A0ACB8U1R9_9APHY|nr:P-loop containing nucleoside triphosphate hydrolase protein [Irpex rosettiformis]
MSVPPTTSRIARPTPRRLQPSSSSSSLNDAVTRLTAQSALNATNTKQYKAALSTEAKALTRTRTNSNSRPQTPSNKIPSDAPASRPKTPTTPRKGVPSPVPFISDMDISRIEPEDALVDCETLEASDVSIEIVEDMPLNNYGQEDKVLVSIRVKPTDQPSVWDHDRSRIKLDPFLGKASQNFNFDEILTGSENKPVYNAVARSHVYAAMDGFNSVIFAYGQTASGKTFTLSGDEEQPGIIPRAMKDVFGYIKQTPTREYLLRCSYLEIYNENIHDLLAPPSMSAAQPVQIHGTGPSLVLAPLREEVVTSLKGVKEVLERGEGNRRTASTDWNERSSRSHSVFRVVIESRERTGTREGGRQTPSGRQTPGTRPPTPGSTRLQAKGGKAVQTSVLSLIDLAGSEKATSDKDRTREGKYINTSLLTLGSVIGTLAENAAKGKQDHVPFRNSKLTRMLQPSLSGDARISVICTINPSKDAVVESTSTLLFAQRIKRVQLHAQKKEVVDTEALLERYRKEIEELKQRLVEREQSAEAPLKRRLSAREQLDESKAMRDLNARIKQLTKLILTSQTVDETKGDESRSVSPVKVDFDLTPYQLQQELLAARRQIDSQATQILSLEEALLARPALPPNAPDSEKDKLLIEQSKTIQELEIVVKGYEDNLGEPLRKVKEDVEKEWSEKVENEAKLREEKVAWADELVRQLEKERRIRLKLEEERRALAAFVQKFDSLSIGSLALPPSKLRPPMPSAGGAGAIFAERQRSRESLGMTMAPVMEVDSPMRPMISLSEPSLLEEQWDALEDVSFEIPFEKVAKPHQVKAVFRKIKENLPI